MITETYRDIEITLLEDENQWRFTANGRERKAPSLPKAREYIDNALDAIATEKVKKWQPFEAWSNDGYGSNDWRKVKVTSIADDGYSGRTEYWTSGPVENRFGTVKNKRKKLSETYLYADTAGNAATIGQITALQSQKEGINEEIWKLREVLTKIPKSEVPQ